MNVLALFKSKSNFVHECCIGTMLGEGADGQVFELLDSPNKVLKLSVIYDLDYDNKHQVIWEKRNKDLLFLQESFNGFPHLCRVHDVEFLFSGERNTYIGKQNYIVYSYKMERLNKISEDEKRVFHSILSHEDANLNKNFSQESLQKILDGLSVGLDFDAQKVKTFYNLIKSSRIKHNDLHVRNIMKNSLNDFKLVDLDRIDIGD